MLPATTDLRAWLVSHTWYSPALAGQRPPSPDSLHFPPRFPPCLRHTSFFTVSPAWISKAPSRAWRTLPGPQVRAHGKTGLNVTNVYCSFAHRSESALARLGSHQPASLFTSLSP